jgi:hypothetical protein
LDFSQGLQAFSSFKTPLSILILCHAAFQDLKKRELGASAWVPILLLGVLTLILEPASTTLLEKALSLVQTLSVLSTLFLLGLYGLGDALILAGICLTHVSTTRPLQGCLIRLLYPDFSLTVLLNAEILSLTTVASNLVHNLRSGAWDSLSREEPFKRRVARMLLLRAVRQSVEAPEEAYNGRKMFFAKQTVPMVVFILPGYVATLLLGSLIPLPA